VSDIVTVGRIGAPVGVQGWMKIQSFTQPIENIVDYRPWYLKRGEKWYLVEMQEVKMRGAGVVALVKNCNDRDATLPFKNLDIGVLKSQLPVLPKGEIYWSDLEGMTVQTVEGKTLGKIDSLLATGANDVMVIKNGDTEYLIPYVKGHVVKNVDLDQRLVLVDWDTDFQ